MRPRGVATVIAWLIATVLFVIFTYPSLPIVNIPRYSPSQPHVDHSQGVFEEQMHTLYSGVNTFVLFIGYARSGHSLVGAILDAHPEVIIPHEFQMINKWNYYKNTTRKSTLKSRLFFDLHSLSREQAMFGNRASCAVGKRLRYCYHVPGQWQGTYKDQLLVIGDKKGTSTGKLLFKEDSFHVLEEIQSALKIRLKFIHVIRNPFDNIATKLLRSADARELARNENFKVNRSSHLDTIITDHFKLVESAHKLHRHGKFEFIDIYSHEIISRPRENLKRLCTFLEVDCETTFIEACAGLLYSKPTATRHSVVWTKEQIRRVSLEMRKYSFMEPYSFYSP